LSQGGSHHAERIDLSRDEPTLPPFALGAFGEVRHAAERIADLTPALLRARYDAKLARMRALSAATLPPLPLDDFDSENAE